MLLQVNPKDERQMDYNYMDYDYEPSHQDIEYLEYYDDDEGLEISDTWKKKSEVPVFSFFEIFQYCVKSTISGSAIHLSNMLIWCLIFNLTSRIVQIPAIFSHIVSAICGGLLIWFMFEARVGFVVGLTSIGLTGLLISHYIIRMHRGPMTCIVSVLYILFCELWLVEPSDWHAIRGAQMVVLMKMVSVGCDLDNNTIVSFPNLFEIVGYLLSPGTVIFGPWISISSYRKFLTPLTTNVFWIFKAVKCFIVSYLFLLLSTCYSSWFVPDSSGKWALAFRDALSFRASHYFVSYFSEAALSLSGLDEISVSKPFKIEIPRSLVEVVINWNIPMHNWLKTYVFKPTKRKYGILPSVVCTYSLSALFHGLNFQLAAVLLSLCFYTYVEYSLREKLAAAFDACILAKPCPEDCEHRKKNHSPYTSIINIGFTAMSVFHLAYLGVMFDSSASQESGFSMEHTLNKWANLGYASHWVALACFVAMSVI